MNFDFDKAWGEIQSKSGEPTSPEQLLEEALRKKSKGTMEQLKNRLKIKLYYLLFFITSLSIYALFRLNQPNILMLIGVVMLYMLPTGIIIYRYWRGLKNYPEMDGKLVDTLKFYKKSVKKALRVEENFGAFFIVASPLIGFLIAHFEKGGDWETFASDPKRLLIILIIVLVYAPIGLLGSRWMNKKAYGEFLDKLDGNIRELEIAAKA